MNAFLAKIIKFLDKINIFKNFAKPFPKKETEIFEEFETFENQNTYPNFQIVGEPISRVETIKEVTEFEVISPTVAVLPQINISESRLLEAPIQNPDEIIPNFANYNIQDTPVLNTETEQEIPVPIKIIKTKKVSPKKKVPSVKKPAKKKAKPRVSKKKEEDVPPEATGFGFLKTYNDSKKK